MQFTVEWRGNPGPGWSTTTPSAGNGARGLKYGRKQFTAELSPDPELSFFPTALFFTIIQD